MTRLVVVGNGMVGSRFVEEVLAADTVGRFRITVLGAEGCEPYNRVLLSEVVAGTYDLASLTLPTPTSSRLAVHRGVAAVHVDREDRVVVASDGVRHRYDRLVLATGSSARIPPLAGLAGAADSAGVADGAGVAGLARGVHALRTIDDAREIVAATLNARRAVVLGAGVLGMEAACGLAHRGIAVTVVHPMTALMERQLDTEASRVVESAMTSLGIDHRIGVGAQDALVEQGRLRGIRLSDGEVIATDLLVLATGTVANTSLATGAGLRTDRGVVVDHALACPDDRRIFAIGDCAQPPEGGSGLVAQGWDQARQLAVALTAGTGTAPPTAQHRVATGGSDVVRLKAHGLDVVTMGVCGTQRADDATQRTLRLSDPERGRHVEVVVRGGILIGATCIGAGAVAADLVATYTRRTPVPSDPAYLLLPALAPHPANAPTSPADLPDDTTICRCNGVTKGLITACVDGGADTVEDVAAATRATTGCGGCREDVCALVDRLVRSPPRANGLTGEIGLTKGKHMNHNAEMPAL